MCVWGVIIWPHLLSSLTIVQCIQYVQTIVDTIERTYIHTHMQTFNRILVVTIFFSFKKKTFSYLGFVFRILSVHVSIACTLFLSSLFHFFKISVFIKYPRKKTKVFKYNE